MVPPAPPSRPVRTAGDVGPHPDDAAEVRAALASADGGTSLSAEQTEAYVRWLETGEGTCPVDFG